MKVKDLIKELQNFDPEKNVRIRGTGERDVLIAYDVKKLSENNFVQYSPVKLEETHILIEVDKEKK